MSYFARQRLSILIKIHLDTTVCRYLFTGTLLYMFRVSQQPSSGVLKTVTAASGTGHNIGTATSLQRGLIRTSKTFFTKWSLNSETILKTEIMVRQPTGEREM